jgi:hypothetical protein
MWTKTEIKETLSLLTSILTCFTAATTGLSHLSHSSPLEECSKFPPNLQLHIKLEQQVNHGKFINYDNE